MHSTKSLYFIVQQLNQKQSLANSSRLDSVLIYNAYSWEETITSGGWDVNIDQNFKFCH